MAKLNYLAAFPIIGLLMCGIAHAEDKAPAPTGAPPPPPHEMHDGKGAPIDAAEQAKRDEMRKKFEAMTPDQRKAFFEERRKEMQARIDAMTPDQREAFKKHMEERRAQFEKEHPGVHPMGGDALPPPPHEGMMKPPMDGEHKAPPPHEKGQPPVGGQPSSDKH